MAHRKRTFYNFLRSKLRKFVLIEKLIQIILINKRTKDAKRLLILSNQYPELINEIIEDYKYSIKYTHRGVFQIVNVESILNYLKRNSIQGDFVEAGTYTGGCSAYILKAQQRIDSKNIRNYWGFDSFEGMPAPSLKDGDQSSIWLTGKMMKDLNKNYIGKLVGHSMNKADYEECYKYLRNTGYPPEKINLVKGWFQNTLKINKSKIKQISLLRLDGDFYESTLTILEELYPLVAIGGAIIIDDYGGFKGCKIAVDEYLDKINYKPHLIYVENSIRYFIKEK